MPHKLYRATLDREEFTADELASEIDGFAEDLDAALKEAGGSEIDIKVPIASDDQALLSVEADDIEESRMDAIARSMAARGSIDLNEVDDSSVED